MDRIGAPALLQPVAVPIERTPSVRTRAESTQPKDPPRDKTPAHVEEDESIVAKAAEALQDDLKAIANLEFHVEYDKEISRYIVSVIDPKNDEIVRQIPPEELIESTKRLRELRGLLFDELS